MTRIRLRQLEQFLAVVEEGSVSRAADRLGISQPSLSTSVTALEHELGLPLFVRSRGRGVHLTPEGRTLVAEARPLVRHAEEVERRLVGLGSASAGRLILGSLVTIAPVLAPRLLRGFLDVVPGVDVSIATFDQKGLLAALRAGDVHLGLTYALDIDDDLEFTPLATVPPRVVLPAGHPAATRPSVSLRELADEPYVLLDLPLSREYFTSLFLSVGLTPRPSLRVRDLALVRSLVANGFGFSIINLVPGSVVSLDGGRIAVVDLADDLPALSLGLVAAPVPVVPEAVARFRSYAGEAIPTLIAEIAGRGDAVDRAPADAPRVAAEVRS